MSKNRNGYFIPVNNVPNEDELLAGGFFDGKERVKESIISPSMANVELDTPNFPTTENNTTVASAQKTKPTGTQVDLVWGFMFFDSPEIYSTGNRIFFDGEVSKDSVNMLKKYIISTSERLITRYHKLGIYEHKDMHIKLYINSPGGAMSAGFDLIDFMQAHHIPIYTVGTGTVASMGVSLLLGGTKKYVTPNTHLLVHQLRAGIQGKRNDMIDYWKHIENIHKQTVSFISKNTTLSEKEVEGMLKSETWLTAEEAVKYGFADEIIS